MKNENERKESLSIVIEQINNLLEKHKIVETLVEKQDPPKQKIIKNLVNKQNINKLERLLANLHPADIADILESLPIEGRLIVWDLVKVESDGDILVEVSDAEYTLMGCNVLATSPRSIIMLEHLPGVQSGLERVGCKIRIYKGMEISRKGEGGPTCLTRPLERNK